MYKRINGIQHIGIGVNDMDASLKFYRKYFGLDIPFFDSVAPAPLMDIYTNNSTITKRASMVVNLQGGCAMEVIRPTTFEPSPCAFDILPGDLGIFCAQFKTRDIQRSYEFCKQDPPPFLSEMTSTPHGLKTFFIKDLDGNMFQYVEGDGAYVDHGHHSMGAVGCSIGVRNINEACNLYSKVLGFDKVVYDHSGEHEDFASAWQNSQNVRRVLLTQSNPPGGGFAKVTGQGYIELVQSLDREPRRIFDDRIWADNGFVHLGFDVKGMADLGEDLKQQGFGFTCDSNDALDMGNTKVHCTYIEDRDGTWLE
ncbi:MAG: VOC family protein, partial [Flavobacteriales bacterium]|nr:VOC family protein [Flavobacteriales bacterium]